MRCPVDALKVARMHVDSFCFDLLAAGVADREEELTGSFLPLDEGVNELHHQLLLTSGQDSRLLESAL